VPSDPALPALIAPPSLSVLRRNSSTKYSLVIGWSLVAIGVVILAFSLVRRPVPARAASSND
jgi:hypothetical protein